MAAVKTVATCDTEGNVNAVPRRSRQVILLQGSGLFEC